VFAAPYYWNAGCWFRAWGYYPKAYYAWDGPIYAYNSLPPHQVIANVQATLQQQGYYHGDVDGLIGPLTHGAIADYQFDNGL
jgi:Putative peptidoglycan binding domain